MFKGRAEHTVTRIEQLLHTHTHLHTEQASQLLEARSKARLNSLLLVVVALAPGLTSPGVMSPSGSAFTTPLDGAEQAGVDM